MRRILAIAILLVALPATASAAEPESGNVSSSSPTTAWSGTLVRPYLHHLVFN